MSKPIPIITIDGPGSSGKGTIGQLLAKTLKWHFLDSGALYRVLALAAMQSGVAIDDEAELARLAITLNVRFVEDKVGDVVRTLLDDNDVSEAIRSEECGAAASKLAVFPTVRDALLERQRVFRQLPGLVADGRDMGTVVFPDASLKIFLLASPQERAARRYQQLKARGIHVSLGALCDELIERDRRDTERAAAPLKPSVNAVIIDTTGLNIAEVLQQVKEAVHSSLGLII